MLLRCWDGRRRFVGPDLVERAHHVSNRISLGVWERLDFMFSTFNYTGDATEVLIVVGELRVLHNQLLPTLLIFNVTFHSAVKIVI